MSSGDEREQLRGFVLAAYLRPSLPRFLPDDALAPIRTTRSLLALRMAARDVVE